MSNEKEKKKEERLQTFESVAQSGAATEVVGRYGSAVKEHFVAYSGMDNENGIEYKKSLDSISKGKINTDNEANIRSAKSSYTGYVAEMKYMAKQNAKKIIEGEKTRIRNADTKGGTFDPIKDHIEIDEHENIISTGQMKFIKVFTKENMSLDERGRKFLEELNKKEWEKYLENDKITVPSDYYQHILNACDEKIANLEKQIEALKNNPEKENILQKKVALLEKTKQIKSKITDSEVTSNEAIFAYEHPKLSTTIDIVKNSHRAGVEQAKFGAIIGGGFSLIQNIVAVNKGEKSAKEAALCVAGNAGKGAVVAYATAFVGSSIKGAMQNASSSTVRTLAKTNLAGTVVAVTKEVSVTMYKYINGEIDGLECLEQLGEKGTGMLSSAMFATLGQMAIPIPVVGAMAGSMLGYALSTAFYGELVNSMKAAKFAKAERERIERECAKAIEMIKAYRAELQANINEYLSDHIAEFSVALKNMDDMYKLGDTEGFIKNANRITKKLGGEPRFKNLDELKSFIKAGGKIKY